MPNMAYCLISIITREKNILHNAGLLIINKPEIHWDSYFDMYMLYYLQINSLCNQNINNIGPCTLSPKLVHNFPTLKNKYDLMCQSRLHTFVHRKKKSDWVFCVFLIRSKHFETCFDNSEPPYKRPPKSRMASDPLRLTAQSTVYRSLHTEFMEIGGLLFNMWLQYH